MEKDEGQGRALGREGMRPRTGRKGIAMSDITVKDLEQTGPREVRITTSSTVAVRFVGEEHVEEADVFRIRGKGGPPPKEAETEVCTAGGRALSEESVKEIWEAVRDQLPGVERGRLLDIIGGHWSGPTMRWRKSTG